MKYAICIKDEGDPRIPSLLKNYRKITNLEYKQLDDGYVEMSFDADKVSDVDYFLTDTMGGYK